MNINKKNNETINEIINFFVNVYSCSIRQIAVYRPHLTEKNFTYH